MASVATSRELLSLASFVSRIHGVMFNEFLSSGAGVGARVSLGRRPNNQYDVNCIDVSLRSWGLIYLLGHLEAGAAAVLSPLLLNARSLVRKASGLVLKRTGWSSLCNSIHRHRSHSVVQSIKEVKGDRSTLRHRETSSIASAMHCNAMDPKNGVQNVALRDQRRAWDAILLLRLLK